ncbi:MAG TPA: ABC transporter permease [Bacillota bacterium]|jgi:simple sugar transport system permease protein
MTEPLFSLNAIVLLLASTMRTTAPVLLAAIGGLYSDRSGVLSIGMEGFMLTGAFAGFVGAFYSGNLWVGLLTAIVAGAALAFLYAYFSISVGSSQAVTGTGIVMLAAGATGFLNRVLFRSSGDFVRITPFQPVAIPGLSHIPVLGPILFNQNILVYLALLLVPVTWFILYRTALGLDIRSVGEHAKAADTVGLNVKFIRYGCVVLSGALGGLGGAYLSLAHANTFIEMMTAERGYVAFAIIIFGKYNPFGALGAALLFGLADALQLKLQVGGLPIPYEFLLMLPYVLTLVAMVLAGRTTSPANLGTAYKEE